MTTNNSNQCHCHECGLSVDLPILAPNQKALCPRCGFTLTTIHNNAVERIIALSITAIIFLLLSIPFEFLSFKAKGLENSFTITQSIFFLFSQGYSILAVIEIFTIFAIPLLILTGLIYLLLFFNQNKTPPYARKILNMIFMLLPWAMVEIFLVGILVSLIKIISMADVGLGPSFISLSLFTLFMTAVILHVDKHQLYLLLNKAEELSSNKLNDVTDSLLDESTNKKTIKNTTNTSNDARKSIQKTWALIITAITFYIPANTLPIMNTRVLGQDDPSTIFGGVLHLWQLGSYPIAIIIFVASVAVPIAKFIVLAWLNYSVQKSHQYLTSERIKLYRMAEFIGRWSMVDVFVVIILASLIQLGNTISIYPGSATLAFSGSVVLTMLAAMAFDSKLIWQETTNNEL